MPGSALARATRPFLAGNAVAMTGIGLVVAFTLIYLHQARGIPQRPRRSAWPQIAGGAPSFKTVFCVCRYRLEM